MTEPRVSEVSCPRDPRHGELVRDVSPGTEDITLVCLQCGYEKKEVLPSAPCEKETSLSAPRKKRGSRGDISLEQREAAVEAYESGVGVGEIASGLGVSKQTIYNWAKAKREEGAVRGPRVKVSRLQELEERVAAIERRIGIEAR